MVGQNNNYTCLWQRKSSFIAFLNIRTLNRYTNGLITLFDSTRKTENTLIKESMSDGRCARNIMLTADITRGKLHRRNDITNSTITLCLLLSLSNLLWCSQVICPTEAICLLCLLMTLIILQEQKTTIIMVITITIATSTIPEYAL